MSRGYAQAVERSRKSQSFVDSTRSTQCEAPLISRGGDQ
ncbi:predicted protein [Botrytis cinerea T4]|uniref:Uncharacterized protein n=1 Tax=Botryotinia fuckeliana (strain T4) TaxID=999810 RepID=G2XXI2_BOTF4|nr:predicted protein [Botrytis cinerea T4]